MAAGAITAVAVVVFVSTLVQASYVSPQDEVTVSTGRTASRGTGPFRLRVPSLDINANVQHVGLGKTGNMAVPTNYTDVGWYRGGSKPGQAGNAVFDGHVDNGFGLAGVFSKLETIKPGAEVLVDYASSTVRFVVTRVESYSKDAVPTGDIFTMTGRPGLVLITCEGDWLESQKTYEQRLVVYALLAPAP